MIENYSRGRKRCLQISRQEEKIDVSHPPLVTLVAKGGIIDIFGW